MAASVSNQIKGKIRLAAKLAREIYYNTGLPCKHGHLSKRFVSNKACFDCNTEATRRAAGLPVPPYPAPTYCECCGKLPGRKGMHIDHCHRTGAFRGWICHGCNVGIGSLGDTLRGVMNAVSYLSGTIRSEGVPT